MFATGGAYLGAVALIVCGFTKYLESGNVGELGSEGESCDRGVDGIIEAMSTILEKRSECVCNVVCEKASCPTTGVGEPEARETQSVQFVIVVGACSLLIGIWLGYGFSRLCVRSPVCSEPLAPQPINVRALDDARRRAVALSR